MPTPNLRIAPLLLTLLLASASHQLSAATTQKNIQLTIKKQQYLTRDELRACMDDTDELAAKREQLRILGTLDQEAGAQIRAETEAITKEQETVPNDQAMINAINEKIQANNQRITERNASVNALNKQNNALNNESAALDKRCSYKLYTLDDKNAILRERQKKTQP